MWKVQSLSSLVLNIITHACDPCPTKLVELLYKCDEQIHFDHRVLLTIKCFDNIYSAKRLSHPHPLFQPSKSKVQFCIYQSGKVVGAAVMVVTSRLCTNVNINHESACTASSCQSPAFPNCFNRQTN